MEEWKDCEELKPNSKEKLIFVDHEAWNRMVPGNQQVSVHEVRKKQQIREDDRNMYRTKIVVKKQRKMGETSLWRSWFSQKNGQKKRSSDLLPKVFGDMRSKEWDRI